MSRVNGATLSFGYFFKASISFEAVGKELYEQYPSMRSWCDRAKASIGVDVPKLLELDLRDPDIAQWALVRNFAVSLGIVNILSDMGIRPQAVAGYSIGMMPAACVTGATEPEDMLQLIMYMTENEAPVDDTRPVGMAHLAFPKEVSQSEIAWHWGPEWPDVFLAADSGLTADGAYRIVTVSGYLDALERLAATIADKERVIVRKFLGALHSPLSRHLRDFIEPQIAALNCRDPQIPLFSGLDEGFLETGGQVAEALMRNYTDPVWADHIRRGMHEQGARLVIAPGPGTPAPMSSLQWPFEVVEVRTPADVERAVAAVEALG